jgi:hypothetical protein
MVGNLPKSVSECLFAVTGQLDLNIAELVLAMRQVGFDTISSCEGHFALTSFKHVKPNVVFCCLDRALVHSWIREISRSVIDYYKAILPVSISVGPIYDPQRDIVHEDIWILEIDVSKCENYVEAQNRRDGTVQYLILMLDRARKNKPLATDTFVRSRW